MTSPLSGTNRSVERRAVYERGLVGLFFLVLAAAGVLVYDEYGIAWDEPGIVEYGHLLLDHYAPGGEWESFINLRYYGPVGPVALALTDRLTEGPAFPPAHLANFAFFFAGAFAFYALCRFQFGSRMWGLLGAALLVLSPRVLSHGFVNPKDMPLMVMFVAAMYFLVRFLDSDRRRWIVLCGVATAFGMGVRITAAFLMALAVGAVAMQAFARRKKGGAPRAGVSAGIYVLVSTALTIAIWPWLWENPVTHFYEAAQLMSNFDEGPMTVLHFGKIVGIGELPWDYLPVWIGITTPPAFLLLIVAGLASIRWKRGLFAGGSRDRFLFLYLAWAFIPLIAIAVLRTPLYDEWRQAMFVYPPLLLFAVAGTRWIARALARPALGRHLVAAGATVLAGILIWTFGTVVRFHPYQAAYLTSLRATVRRRTSTSTTGASPTRRPASAC